MQIHSVVMAIGCAMEGLECHVFIGGRAVSQDKHHLKKCHIAVGSPGEAATDLLPNEGVVLWFCDRALCNVRRSDQAADRAGHVVHGQHQAVCPGRG